jgi:2-polyprenyl-3-methyl-5-hydroxy-6-metoxy-1,4-benzoquinol methylase
MFHGQHVSDRWRAWRSAVDLDDYDTRWERMEATGAATHGEADFIESFTRSSVLDAGCGMGRVAIELGRRGIDVVGVDLDDDLLAYARRHAPAMTWVHADLATVQLARRFDVVAMPGNVMIFCRPADRRAIVHNVAGHLVSDGALVAGFTLEQGPQALTLDEYDALCTSCGLTLVERWATWQRDTFEGGDYAVSVHRRPGPPSTG